MTTPTHDHIVRSYDGELLRLNGEIEHMAALASAQIEHAMRAFEQRDSAAADRVIAADAVIDRLEQEISQDVLKLLALRQPLARDLREVYAALRISSDIERVGDYATNVAKRSRILNQSAPLLPARGLSALARVATEQFAAAMAAYHARDAEQALIVRASDTEVDAHYTALFRELLTYMAESPQQITPCTHLLFMAKNLERIGDHATNIAEATWFVVHGEVFAEQREKADLTSQ
ncbi:MAG: phosphate transport system regulatory protein PhoU [Lysobacterales bacterium CG02_land_8_20_14_3_00_62_12]|nr:MAG: phosphate transport system regulatory protein PhoU [Xanthomonadales bacterium CG02_land_8_20_14_3_00_62_12]